MFKINDRRLKISICFKVLLFGPLVVVGRNLWNRVFPTFRFSLLPSALAFSWNCIIYFFLNFGMALETHMKLCVTAEFSRNFFFAQKNGEMDQKWTRIWFIMKLYVICCFPAQISHFGKFWCMRYGPKCSQPMRLEDFLTNHISRTNQWNGLIFCMLIQIHIK